MKTLLSHAAWLLFVPSLWAAEARYFAIEVVDADTGRGVPLVELRTVNELRFVTDNAGRVAFDEPGLLGEEVFFFVRSHGYEMAADGFGFRGVRLKTAAGASSTIRLQRKNVAERLYRITGAGQYADTRRLGLAAPVREPLLNGRVLGQDSVLTAVYRGRVYWFWGDTNRAAYPLGHFRTAGATSRLPSDGGLDPNVGVDLTYFVDNTGFSRPVAPLDGPGMIWLDGLTTVPSDGAERLVAHYSRMKSLGERLEHGLVVYDDHAERFELVTAFPADMPAEPRGHVLPVERDGVAWLYYCSPYPLVRVRAAWDALRDVARYESYTCLAPGRRYDKSAPVIDRDPDGKVKWNWKANTGSIDLKRLKELVAGRHVPADEAWWSVRDVESDKPIDLHAGTIAWNAFRRRWVMIGEQAFGTSFLGEIWYAEADAPEGPWRRARKIVTHDDYSFYNPRHHPFFDQAGGRYLFFEATYTKMFSGTKEGTPRYDYNQIMYRLDLSDPRLEAVAKDK